MSFLDFAAQNGLDIPLGKFYPSDKIKRCGTTDKPKSDNGAFFWDGQRGWVMNWSLDQKVHWYHDKTAKPWTEDEKQYWRDRRRVEAMKKSEAQVKAAQKAMRDLRFAILRDHIYLDVKGFRETEGLVLDEKLLVPMRNMRTNLIQGYQAIWWDKTKKDYVKKMLYGMKAAEAVFYIGKTKNTEYWLVEGYATGLSLAEGLKRACIPATVVVCFSANNLGTVARYLASMGNVYIFADNDASKTGQKVAEASGCRWGMAETEGWDANDLHQRKGILALVRKIMEIRLDPLLKAV
jgi:putative DNA primase/helicase